MSRIVLPIADSGSESDSYETYDASAYADTETESESGDAGLDTFAGACRPSALRQPLLQRDGARAPAAANLAASTGPPCRVLIHSSHRNEAGIVTLAAALRELGQELFRVGARPSAARYPRLVPRCPAVAISHFGHWMRRMRLHLDALDEGEDELNS